MSDAVLNVPFSPKADIREVSMLTSRSAVEVRTLGKGYVTPDDRCGFGEP
jgi:hypothetical protein